MILSRKHKFCFIHIPKCAGTSIRKMIAKADPERFQLWGWRWLARHQRYGDTAHMPLIDLVPYLLKEVHDYRAVTVVRDPLDRFYSSYEEHFSQHGYRARISPEELLFELNTTNIRYDPAYVHFCPQHYFIAINDKTYIDDILRFEDTSWPDKLREIMIERGMPAENLELPELNRSRKQQRVPLSKRALEHLYRLYKRDYTMLGYTPPISEDFVLRTSLTFAKARPFDFSAYDTVHFLKATFKKNQ